MVDTGIRHRHRMVPLEEATGAGPARMAALAVARTEAPAEAHMAVRVGVHMEEGVLMEAVAELRLI